MLKLIHASKIYAKNGICALNAVDLTVQDGDYISVTGASGSGKSTLMHILGLLDSLTDGFVNGELINRKFDKGTGIKAICDHLGCTLADTIGFGDSDNDLQMTDVVGISVCMANGSDNLKKLCDRICPAVTEDGVARELKTLGLI